MGHLSHGRIVKIMVKIMNNGILYIATKYKYLKEARQSAKSVRKYHPDIPITIEIRKDLSDYITSDSVFDNIIITNELSHGFESSLLHHRHIVYDKTLFLDSDTLICDRLDGVFDMLDIYDFAGCHEPTRNGNCEHGHSHNVPDSFSQINGGVLAYCDNGRIRVLFDNWFDIHNDIIDKVHAGLTQPSLRMALYDGGLSGLKVGILPPEYNIRLGNVTGNLAFASGKIKILHGRSSLYDIEDLAQYCNMSEGERIINNTSYPPEIICRDNSMNMMQRIDRFNWYIYKNGFINGFIILRDMVKERLA